MRLGSSDCKNAAAGEKIPGGREGPPDLHPVTLSAATAAAWHFIRAAPTNVSSRPRLRMKPPPNLALRHFRGGGQGAAGVKPHGSPPAGLQSTRRFSPLTRVTAQLAVHFSPHIRRGAQAAERSGELQGSVCEHNRLKVHSLSLPLSILSQAVVPAKSLSVWRLQDRCTPSSKKTVSLSSTTQSHNDQDPV